MKHGTNQLGGEMESTLPGLWKAFTIPALTGGYGMAFVAALFWTRVLSREPLSGPIPCWPWATCRCSWAPTTCWERRSHR